MFRGLVLLIAPFLIFCSKPSKQAPDAGDSETEIDLCPSGNAFTNCDNGWCRIEPGTFMLGSPETEPCRGAYTENQVQVTLTRAFLIRQHEVTQAEWEAVGFPNPATDVNPGKPITWINWFESLAYCNSLSEAEGLEPCYDLSSCSGEFGAGCPNGYGLCNSTNIPEGFPPIYECDADVHKHANWYECPGYRLPTSAEWEYATRAGTITSTYNGDVTTDDSSCQVDPVVEPIAWYCANSDDPRRLQPVCEKQPNEWGLFDALGNAGEWIDYVYTGFSLEWGEGTDGPFVDPLGAGVDVDGRRSLTGGAYTMHACYSRSAEHFGHDAHWRVNKSGFRPVRTIQ
jgi:formylglycine-generating enzyme required for sulfatase activity